MGFFLNGDSSTRYSQWERSERLKTWIEGGSTQWFQILQEAGELAPKWNEGYPPQEGRSQENESLSQFIADNLHFFCEKKQGQRESQRES